MRGGAGWRNGIGRCAACAPLRAWALALGLVAAAALPPPLVAPAIAETAAAPRPAHLMADRLRIDAQGRLIAEGAVEIWQGNTRLTARRVVYDQSRRHLSIEGPMVLSEGPERLVVASAAELADDLRDGLIEGAQLVLHRQLQLAAGRLTREDGRLTRLEAVVASTCEVCAASPVPLWEVRAARVTHDLEARTLRFEQAQFRLRGVPVAQLPRLTLPDGSVDRARGFLRPEIRVSSDLGPRIALPYFIPIGPDRDLTLTPQASTEGMVSLGFRWRQVFAAGGVDIGGQISRDRIRPGDWRGYAYLRALFAAGAGFTLSADIIAPGDRTYLETYGITDSARLRSHVTLERVRRDQAIRARVLAFRSLLPGDIDERLPNRALQADWDQRLAGGPLGGEVLLAARLRAHHRRARFDAALGPEASRDVAQAALFARWQRRAILPGGILGAVAVQGRIDRVRIGDDPRFPETVGRRSAEAMVELRWPWAAVDAAGGQQLIEPVAQWIAAHRRGTVLPNEDHRLPELDGGNLFAPVRHAGLDAPDDGPRANLGLRWARHDAAGWSAEGLVGRVWRREALAGFDPAHRQPLGAMRSDWLVAGRLTSAAGTALGIRMLFDDARRFSRGEASLTWARHRGTSLASRFLYVASSTAEARPVRLSEWSFDVSHRFESGWVGRLGWDYDLGGREWGAARAGLEFRNECMAVDVSLSRRFAGSTNLSAATNFGLRVELLGLSGRSPGSPGRACRA